MKLEEAFAVITDVENSCSTDQIKIGKFDAWPLIRLLVWTTLTSPTNDDSRSIKKIVQYVKQYPIRDLLDYGFDLVLSTLPRFITSRLQPLPPNKHVIFIGRSSHLQRIGESKWPFDRVLDPIQDSLQDYILTKKFVLGPKSTSHTSTKTIRIRRILDRDFLEIHGLDKSGLLDSLQSTKIDIDDFLKTLMQYASKFWMGYRIGANWVRGLDNTQHVFVASWYGPDMMGIIAAFQEAGVCVTDVQHGFQGSVDGMYMGWAKSRSKGYLMLPANFWTWSNSASSDILESTNFRKVHQPVVGGYPWIDYWNKQQLNKMPQEIQVKTSIFRIRLLVILRPPDSPDTERIPDFLLDFLRRENPDVIVNFRTHPNDRDGFDYVKNRLEGTFATKFYVTSHKIDLYSELQRSTHLISPYSSVCLEASFFALPVLTYGEDSLSVFSNQIQSGELAWTKGNTDDIEKFINNNSFVQKQPAPYITSSVQFAQSVAVSLIAKKLGKGQLT